MVRSPWSEVVIPETNLADYVWQDVAEKADLPALVRKISRDLYPQRCWGWILIRSICSRIRILKIGNLKTESRSCLHSSRISIQAFKFFTGKIEKFTLNSKKLFLLFGSVYRIRIQAAF